MLTGSLLSFVLLLSTQTQGAAQGPATRSPAEKAAAQKDDADAQKGADEDAPPGADEDAEAAGRRAALLAELRALEAESKEPLKPLDAASARAEIANAAWTLDREWAKSLLREALALTFPAEVDRARLRESATGAALRPGPAEDGARVRVRRRVFKVAARDREFARELGELSGRELGRVEETQRAAAMAAEAADEGRLEEAA